MVVASFCSVACEVASKQVGGREVQFKLWRGQSSRRFNSVILCCLLALKTFPRIVREDSRVDILRQYNYAS